MAFAIEASSLASITSIADSPPIELADFRYRDYETLTLYITRVPGSRDVFLTPLKPRDRVVSAEDIQSALYYVHFNSSEDVGTISKTIQDGIEKPGEVWQEKSLPRFEAPRSASSMVSSSQSKLDMTDAPLLPPRPHVRRKPVKSQTNDEVFGQPILPRRPLPGLPTQNNSTQEITPVPVNLHETTAFDGNTGSLTIIRREPSTAQQWNVAMVRDTSVPSSGRRSITAAQTAKQSGAPFLIDISNPAYSAFDPREEQFKRRLCLPRAASIDANGVGIPQIDMRKSGYCFKSPWNTLCEFTTTSVARALVCRHSPAGEHPQEVSELRFNLPSGSADLTTRAQKRQSYVPTDQRRSRMDAIRGISRSEDSTFDLDLSLGQEMAGGGFGGRQPKLGKLIIYPQGLAMLDLLVAANIGLWWRAWEKVS